MKKFVFIILGFLFINISCSAKCNTHNERIFYGVIKSFIIKMEQQGFEAAGVGGGLKEGKDSFFGIFFRVEEGLTIETARRLGVNTVHEFLNHINASKKIRNNLIQFPLTEQYVTVFIRTKKTNHEVEHSVVSVMAGEGTICYYEDSVKAPNFGLIYSETFEEAERILSAEQTATYSPAIP